MFELRVFALDVPHDVATSADLSVVLAARVGGGNHFEIAAAERVHPMLDLLVQDRFAVVHYFAREGVAGDQAVSTLDDPPEEVDFPHGRERLTMPGSVLIGVDTAIACAEQFAETLSRPSLVDWIEL